MCPPHLQPRVAPLRPNHRSPVRPSGMAAAKAEMQLMSPLQITDPFGSFPHSPAMDNYPKLEEMMMMSNGAPQFLGAAGAPEGSGGSSSSSSGGGGGGGGSSNSSSGSAFNPQGEAGEQPYEHLTSGKRWPTPRLSPFATTPASRPSPQPVQDLGDASGVSLLFLASQSQVLEGCLGTSPTPTLLIPSGARRSELLFWMESSRAAWVGDGGGGLVLISRTARPSPPPEKLALPAARPQGRAVNRGQGCPGSPGRGCAPAVAERVLAGIPGPRRRCGALGAAVEGDSPYLRQLLLNWVLPLERVQEHCSLLLSIINQLGRQW